jgi:hypothetical protein
MALTAVRHLVENLRSGHAIREIVRNRTMESSLTRQWLLAQTKGQMFFKFPGGRDHVINTEILWGLQYLINHFRLSGQTSLKSFIEQVLNGKKFDCSCPPVMKQVILFDNTMILTQDCNVRLFELVNKLNNKTFQKRLESVNVDLLEFLIEHAHDNNILSDLDSQIDAIYANFSTEIITPILRPITVKSEMVNINYRVDFQIKLITLCRLIEGTNLSCRARFNPMYDKYVTVYFPCSTENFMSKHKQLELTNETEVDNCKQRYCTLLVYETGCITQSNPTEILAHEVRQIFLSLITLVSHQIRMS